ncbi:uncharacterized protein EI97DRAFT_432494 [Westerdykella ornata]|uniref:RCC1/BLIP-II n=1 Tax=Westerdykella ornata TaxID=318751 RepID=A0A6A6JN33_WESOR|nr:uncharacterized protein EI97DRAFT_432494 [Westerdykella ornata]KAF2277635.1 hypothetical protein EI97DRAFT_432494 [Westerdykella ornata]
MAPPMRKLYAFGFNLGEPGENALFPKVPWSSAVDEAIGRGDKGKDYIVDEPRLLACALHVEVLSCSWCDSLVAINATTSAQGSTFHYSGMGLSPSQSRYLISQPVLRSDSMRDVKVFADAMGRGIQGFLLNRISDVPLDSGFEPPSLADCTTLTVFIPLHEAKKSEDDYITVTLRPGLRIEHVAIGAEGRTTFTTAEPGPGLKGSSPHIHRYIRTVANPSQLLDWAKRHQIDASPDCVSTDSHKSCKEQCSPFPDPLATLISNHTTITLLTTTGQVYSFFPDPRFPRCLGRPCDPFHSPSDTPTPIPYLSETRIVKIATGGYMTAAISVDGEFFIWGQAGPGMEELAVLRGTEQYQEVEEQDEFVKLVHLAIDGHPARATHVAVGSGHVLVAAEADVQETGKVLRAVFAAGNAEYGQLGIGRKRKFVDNFVEVPDFRGCKVVDLAAAGWASWVLVEAEEELGRR